MLPQERVTIIQGDLDVVTARSLVREIAKNLGFMPIDQARIATAVSELARNIFLYAGTGQVVVRGVEKAGKKGVEIVCEDQGPGIQDIECALQDGYSTSGGKGMGLPGARRLMDDFIVHSVVGVGTTVTCRKWRK
ncbi:MAG: anti-sigma regulatory factor [Chloroflexaceae bacterium]|nr:anti-sigma regulatory factor [Chloroflexaceae bacterium]